VVDVLTKMLQKAANDDLIKGLGSELVPDGVINLQYADDTLLLLDKDEAHARNMKCILTCFEMISGMRMNFHKSELVSINMEQESEVQIYAETFGCPVGGFPIKYLGIPLHYQKLRRDDLHPLVDKIIKRIAGWREKLLNKAGRIILIKACLASIPVYLMSFFLISKMGH
jgi:hypothetical protein